MPSEEKLSKVFISYSHDSQEHFDRVLLLSDTLREWGIDCHVDQYELAPADWLRWMERRIREADYVLIVCTETYCRRFNGQEEPGKGLGVRHEGGVISVELYNRQTETAKFIPVVFSAADSAHIPTSLQATHRHTLNIEQLETDQGFENLYRQLTRQPRVIAKPLGKMRSLPPINRQENFDEQDQAPNAASSAQETGIDLKEMMPGLSPFNKLTITEWKPADGPPKLATPIPKPDVELPNKLQLPKRSPSAVHQNFTEDLGKGVKLEMVAIPGSEFLMGSEDIENTKPVHRVKLSPFHIGKYQVTQAQWQAVMNNNPSLYKGDDLPVEHVSWEEASRFCRKLSEKTGKKYRLPTESEWEYACRAGSTGKFCFGDNNAQLEKYAWYDKNAGDKTHPVGEKLPNDWGIHDMHGNVWEWCQDWYDEDYYWESPEENPQGPSSGTYRVLRGSSFSHLKDQCRSASRGRFTPDTVYRYVGFRVVCIAKT